MAAPVRLPCSQADQRKRAASMPDVSPVRVTPGRGVLPGDMRGRAGLVAWLDARVVPEALTNGRRLVPLMRPLVCTQPARKLFVCVGVGNRDHRPRTTVYAQGYLYERLAFRQE